MTDRAGHAIARVAIACDTEAVTGRSDAPTVRSEIDLDERVKMSLRRLATRVGDEGGIVAAIDYGIRDTDIEDADVAAIWAEVQGLYDRMVPLMDQLDRRIRQARAA